MLPGQVQQVRERSGVDSPGVASERGSVSVRILACASALGENDPGFLCPQPGVMRANSYEPAIENLKTARQGVLLKSAHGFCCEEGEVREKDDVASAEERAHRVPRLPQRFNRVHIKSRPAQRSLMIASTSAASSMSAPRDGSQPPC